MSSLQATRPRILYVTGHCPCGPAYGARLRAFHVGKLLERVGEVSLLLVTREKPGAAELELTNANFKLAGVVPVEATARRMADRLRQAIDPRYPGIRNESVSRSDRNRIYRLCESHDVVWFHTVRIPDAIGMFRCDGSVLDVDDLQSAIYRGRRQSQRSPVRKVLEVRMARMWRRRESLFRDRFDVLCVCSSEDREVLGCRERSFVVANGFDPLIGRSEKVRGRGSTAPRLGFIGLMDYGPNVDAVDWFLKRVWSDVRARVPGIRLRLVGRGSDTGRFAALPGVDALGWLEDADAELATWNAMIVPIRFGGGTRIKIAEAFARGCPVVTTTVGAHGYGITNGREALVADRATDFARACVTLVNDRELGRRLAESAHVAYLERWTWAAQADSVARAVSHCLQLGRCIPCMDT